MKPTVLIENERLAIRAARPAELAYIARLERGPENSPFITPWPLARHKRSEGVDGIHHAILEAKPKGRVGFAIFNNWPGSDGTLELKRIVVEDKGRGHGRDAIRLIKELAFNRLRVHRLELDVKDFNDRAKRLYESEGFEIEGALRECGQYQGRYYSRILMSILR